jgi:hypothetical protein
MALGISAGRRQHDRRPLPCGPLAAHHVLDEVHPLCRPGHQHAGRPVPASRRAGLFHWPGDASKLGFQALIDGNMHPFCMDEGGRNKRDLIKDSKEFACGFCVSPVGKRIAYHEAIRYTSPTPTAPGQPRPALHSYSRKWQDSGFGQLPSLPRFTIS